MAVIIGDAPGGDKRLTTYSHAAMPVAFANEWGAGHAAEPEAPGLRGEPQASVSGTGQRRPVLSSASLRRVPRNERRPA